MGKSKQSEENKVLEQELRSMILSNVRMSNDQMAATPERGFGSGLRGGLRGRGGFQHQHPHAGRHAQAPINTVETSTGNFAPQSPAFHPTGPPCFAPPGPHQHHHSGYHRGGLRGNDHHPPHFLMHGHHPQRSRPWPGRDRGRGYGPPPPFDHHQVPKRSEEDQQQLFQPDAAPNLNGTHPRNRGPPTAPPVAVFIAQCEYLDRIAAVEIPPIEMEPEELAMKEALSLRLERICQEAVSCTYPDLDATIHLQCYGSLVSGFATKGSDVDMTIRWSGPTPQDARFQAELPRVLEHAILSAGFGARLLSRTRVPIIKICETPTDDLLKALEKERQKWEMLLDNEKYPELAPPSPTREDRLDVVQEDFDYIKSPQLQPGKIDPDVSRSGKVMEVPSLGPKFDTIEFLESLKPPTEDSGNNSLHGYVRKFIATANKLLYKKELDDYAACTRLFEGLPPTLRAGVMFKCNFDPQNPSSYLFNDACRITLDAVNRREQASGGSSAQKQWTRERAMGPLDFPKSGVGIQCDINFSNPLGIHNTSLLRCYSRCDPRVRPMILFVKAWAKRRKINSAYSGTLSSYGYVLMVLHFLVNVAQPPVLPNLQHAFGSAQREILFDGYNISFWNDEQHIQQMAAQKQLTQNSEPLGVLLRNFFQYYATPGHNVQAGGFNWMKDVLSLRTLIGGKLSKEQKGWTGAKTITVDNREVRQRYLFAIEDPFEIDHNVARPVTHNGIVAIRDEFRRAWRILLAVGGSRQPEGELFEAVKEVVPVTKPDDKTNEAVVPHGAESKDTVAGLESELLPGLGGISLELVTRQTSNLDEVESTLISPYTVGIAQALHGI